MWKLNDDGSTKGLQRYWDASWWPNRYGEAFVLPPNPLDSEKLYSSTVSTTGHNALNINYIELTQGPDRPVRRQEKSVEFSQLFQQCCVKTHAFQKNPLVILELGCGTANGAIAALRYIYLFIIYQHMYTRMYILMMI